MQRRSAKGTAVRRQFKRERAILGQVRDVEDSLWDVRQIRDTKHGFDLLFGSPVTHLGCYRGGLPRLIVTKELHNYWDANRTNREGVIYDLPAGRTTLKRARHRLGFNVLKDASKFWKARIDDLKTLSARQFADRHRVKVLVVVDTRRKLLGRQLRELNWWREPAVLNVLLANITLREMGEQLDMSISQAFRLRNRARRLYLTAA